MTHYPHLTQTLIKLKMKEFIPRIKWSEFLYHQPLRIVITDWHNLKTLFANSYLLIPSLLEYKGRKIELCVPYRPFTRLLRKLPLEKQRWITDGKAVIEIMKTPMRDHYGMRILKVELYIPEAK